LHGNLYALDLEENVEFSDVNTENIDNLRIHDTRNYLLLIEYSDDIKILGTNTYNAETCRAIEWKHDKILQCAANKTNTLK